MAKKQPPPDELPHVCAPCNGRGECADCAGFGQVGLTACDACRGTGTCSSCGGSGIQK